MKQIFIILFSLLSIMSYSQISYSFEKIQKKFGIENVTELKVNENHFQIKKLTETETIKFTYDMENIVSMIEVVSTEGFDNDQFHKFTKQLNPKFKLTSSGNTETLNTYYDSKNGLLNIKVYKANDKSKMNKIIFISNQKIITELIPDIKNWK